MKAVAVIGAMYGDEGKGLIVDYLARNLTNPIVVRFQGGAQAGHTVADPVTKDEHVFSHFGSGTLAGASTILTSNFVSNPYIFWKEAMELDDKRAAAKDPNRLPPTVYVDRNSPITTPFEVEFNRALEKSRGENAHGSVGIGFGETIERESMGVSLLYKHLYETEKSIIRRMLRVYRYFVEKSKMENLESMVTRLSKKEIVDLIHTYLTTLSFFKDNTFTFDPGKSLSMNSIILEGSQGLKLDMGYGDFPYVTRSRTGLVPAVDFCDSMGINLCEAIYVTRFYTTRHGNGPLKQESNWDDSIAKQFEVMLGHDKTNTKKDYQGKLRVAPFDYAEIKRLIELDVFESMYKGGVSKAMTWLNWLGNFEYIPIVGKEGVWSYSSVSSFIDTVVNGFDYLSFGKTHKTVFKNSRKGGQDACRTD